MKSNFYVYGLYSRGRQKGELFYIGKGKGTRAWDHYKPSSLGKNTHKNNIIKNQRTYPMIRHGGLTEEFSHALEMCLIQLYKPQLTNGTDGGEGTSGYKHSKKSKAKMSEAHIGKVLSEETRNKMSEAKIGKVLSEETRNKILDSRDRKPFLIKTEDGAVVLRAESTCCEVAQKFLGKCSSHISRLLNSKSYSLFFKINGNIYYLEYENQTLNERAKLLGKNIASDLTKLKAFKSEITVQKEGKCYYLKGYKTYSDAGKKLGLCTHSELSGFCKMVSGKIQSSGGYSLERL